MSRTNRSGAHPALGLLLAAALAPPAAAQGDAERLGPGPAPVDRFHPARRAAPDAPPPRPALGGSATVHLEAELDTLNYALRNNALARRVLELLHEPLLARDWETWELEPRLCTGYAVEDALVLTDEAAARLGERALEVRQPAPAEGQPPRPPLRIVFGATESTGEGWRVAPRSAGNPLDAPLELAAADVRERLEQVVITFELRGDVLWHDAAGFERHPLDARDVRFSWELYTNPHVDCGSRRWQFQKILDCQVLGPRTVRFVFGEQYYQTLGTAGELVLLPSHLYDLRDPDHRAHDASASPKAWGEAINTNPHNRVWVGLGPYRLVEATPRRLVARRFEGYFADEPELAGHLDEIVWRAIPDDGAAFQALLAGEIDYFDRVQSEDFFGPATASEAFTSRLYKGHYYLPVYGFVAWNLLQPQFEDLRVRRALAQAFDLGEFARTYYKGLVQVVTGPFPFFSPAYDQDVRPLPFDLDAAREELADAGWYDRDADGWLDKDGAPLRFVYQTMEGNKTGLAVGLRLQETLKTLGIDMRIQSGTAQAVWSDAQQHRFEAASLAWVPDIEADPEQIFHSRWADPQVRSANLGCLADAELDAAIERAQREMDPDERQALWRAVHARVYALQPYLFLYNPPRKFAMSKALRGHQSFFIDPGYSIRRWHYPEGTPGTRPLPPPR